MTIDPVLWPKKYKKGFHLKIRITKDRKSKYLPTGLFLPDEKYFKDGKVTAHFIKHIEYNKFLRKKIDEVESKKLFNPQADLYSWIDGFIKASTKNPNTVKVYRTVSRTLKAWRPELTWEDINKKFYSDYIEHLKGKDFTLNTIGKHIKTLKTFLNAAYDEGVNTNLEHRKKYFAGMQEQTDSIYLTEKEIKAIAKLKLTGQELYERDRLLLGCYTGLRFSDLVRLNKDHIYSEKGSYFIKIKAVKTQNTNNSINIPLKQAAYEILKKYDLSSPPSAGGDSGMTVANRLLKQIGKKAGLDSDVLVIRNKGGRMEETSIKKWELLSTHTGRRSFATNAWLAGVPWLSISKITGHKTEKAFLRYIKITSEDNANLLKSHDFFK